MTDKDRKDMFDLRVSVEEAVRAAWPGGSPSKAGLDVVTALLWTTSTVLECRAHLQGLRDDRERRGW
jgi:hypothetical protein